MYAYATVKLRQLNLVAAVELAGKLLVAALLFPKLGYIAVPLGTSAVHLAGVAIAYRRLGPRRSPSTPHS
jgi:hypothetical protein